MRTMMMGLVLGCGLAAAVVSPGLACAWSDQAAAAQQQQTAQAQPASTQTTTTQ